MRSSNNIQVTQMHIMHNILFEKLEIRSVERGICPIATSTIN